MEEQVYPSSRVPPLPPVPPPQGPTSPASRPLRMRYVRDPRDPDAGFTRFSNRVFLNTQFFHIFTSTGGDVKGWRGCTVRVVLFFVSFVWITLAIIVLYVKKRVWKSSLKSLRHTPRGNLAGLCRTEKSEATAGGVWV